MPWDWFILDMAYVLVLLGGGIIFRSKSVGVGAWMAFGLLSASVGAFLFAGTYGAQQAFAASATQDVVVALSGSC